MPATKSKRLTTRRRERLNKLGRLKEKKMRKLAKERMEKKEKVPKSVLMTEDQRRKLKEIKMATDERNKNAVVEAEDPQHIRRINECLEACDAFVELLDYRDIDGSRSKDIEQRIKSENKKIYVLYSHYEEDLPVNTDHLVSDGLTVLNSIEELLSDSTTVNGKGISSGKKASGKKASNGKRTGETRRLCIFGQPNSGKFLLTKQLEDRSETVSVEKVTVPVNKVTPSAVFRKAFPMSNSDLVGLFEKIYPFLTDRTALCDFYTVEECEDWRDFLNKLNEKNSLESRMRKRLEIGATRFFRDVLASKIAWCVSEKEYKFRFE